MGAPAWFKFYPADFLLDPDVSELTLAEQGLLVRMWCVCARDGSVPFDARKMALRVQTGYRIVSRLAPRCLPFFHRVGDELVSIRMLEEQGKREQVSAVRAFAGSKGGRQKVANATAIAGDGFKQLLKQTGSNTESESEKNPYSPQKAGTNEGVVKVKGRKKKDGSIEIVDVPAETFMLAKQIVSGWRKEDPDGRKVVSVVAQVAMRMVAIGARQERFSPEVLAEAGRDYCRMERKRYKAAHNFLSLLEEPETGRQPFYEWAVAVVKRRESVAQQVELLPQEVGS